MGGADESIAAELARLPGWLQEADGIRKTYGFGGFREAMKFVHRVVDLGEPVRIVIEGRRVTLTLASPEGLALARTIDHPA